MAGSDLATNQSIIASSITNKTWSVLYAHTLDGTETGMDETKLRGILQYCKDNNVSVVPYSYIFDNFSSTDLEKRIVALGG
jgi:hypothetical protein